MNRRLLLGAILVVFTAGEVLSDPVEERREDGAVYRLEEPGLQAGGAATAATVQEANAIPASSPLAELRARHLAASQALLQSLRGARDKVERDGLERQATELKSRQAREELEWLRADALSRGDAAYARRLSEALRELEPATATIPASRSVAPAGANGEGEDK